MISIKLTSIYVDDQTKALAFYTEPDQHPAAQTFKAALTADGVPFTQDVTDYGNVAVAVLDDTCGNLIRLAMTKDATA
ncbi:hypothetical protein HF995_01860 [Sanguibacter hominis ATCC BAA-789]|uniref:VOC domain-containing protein n=1 Tax=Sanguibacter hominis ATCC BAA-789 TaxID=1312740 RepID=A0A9X5IQW0_9MICO|nr:hypothetical protein [Sanguibacter hominis ATCC BAA-789]